MHGLIARTLQCFLQDTYGQAVWQDICRAARFDTSEFEAMLDYETATVQAVLNAAVNRLNKPREVILEDIGTYLITHRNNEGLRRLMRYGGVDFIDFLHSLEELPGRARLAVADLSLPALELSDSAAGQFLLVCRDKGLMLPGFGNVLVGVLRSMADDYGALVLLDHLGGEDASECIRISVIETDYAEGRGFELSASCVARHGIAS